MAVFQYIARTAKGEEVTGTMTADNEGAVARSLDEKKLFPIRVTEQAAKRRSFSIGTRVSMSQVGITYGQLADLLKAGVPLLRSLETVARAMGDGTLKTLLMKVRDHVSEGKTFADAMGENPKVFTPLHCAMVRAGERGGFLEDVLANMADFLERQDELRSKVRGALIYPTVLAVLGSVMIVGILVILVPQFRAFFTGVQLPAPTVILFAVSDAIRSYWLLLIAIGLMGFMGARRVRASTAGRRAWERWRMKIPLAGKALLMVSITRFCRILGTMLNNGVPILQALAISKDAAGSEIIAQCIDRAADNVQAGQPLAQPLRESNLFPPEIVEMISVAEESNQMEKVLIQIADTVERRTMRQVDQAVRLVEPLLLLVMAVAIGFVAVGLLYPIFTMGQVLGK